MSEVTAGDLGRLTIHDDAVLIAAQVVAWFGVASRDELADAIIWFHTLADTMHDLALAVDR